MRRRNLNIVKSLLSQNLRNRLSGPFHFIEDGYTSLRSIVGIGRRPDFLIVGAQKSGTTTLFNVLARDSAVSEPFRKEIGYFDRKFNRFSLRWYFANFNAVEEIMTGEATPDYLFSIEAPQRVKNALPSVRLIVILRDPVSRALSHYYHEVRLGREKLDLVTAMEREELRLLPGYSASDDPASKMTLAQRRHHFSYCSRGMYGEQLSRWLAVFPVKQFCFLRFDDLRTNPGTLIRKVTDFLDLDIDPGLGIGPKENKGVYDTDISCFPKNFADQFIEDQSLLKKLVGFSLLEK